LFVLIITIQLSRSSGNQLSGWHTLPPEAFFVGLISYHPFCLNLPEFSFSHEIHGTAVCSMESGLAMIAVELSISIG